MARVIWVRRYGVDVSDRGVGAEHDLPVRSVGRPEDPTPFLWVSVLAQVQMRTVGVHGRAQTRGTGRQGHKSGAPAVRRVPRSGRRPVDPETSGGTIPRYDVEVPLEPHDLAESRVRGVRRESFVTAPRHPQSEDWRGKPDEVSFAMMSPATASTPRTSRYSSDDCWKTPLPLRLGRGATRR